MKRPDRRHAVFPFTIGLLAGVALAAALYATSANADTTSLSGESTVTVSSQATVGRYALSCVGQGWEHIRCFIMDTTNGRAHIIPMILSDPRWSPPASSIRPPDNYKDHE